MAVTKLPRTRKGMLSQAPPLSWPNDTTIGPRRPHLGLLRRATHNRQQHRISNLTASSRYNMPKPTHHSPSRSRAPRASGQSRYKAHKRTHHSAQQSKAPRVSGKSPKQTEKLATPKPLPHARKQPKASQVPSSSLMDKKADTTSQKDNQKGKLIPPSPFPTSKQPPKLTRPAPRQQPNP